jgi:hydroxylamine dehydrogenase
MGFDHPQWEMYSSSKHGVRALLKQIGILPETAAAPTCQTCHMQDGNHEVRTSWLSTMRPRRSSTNCS